VAFKDEILQMAREYADLECEYFGTKHVWSAIDAAIPGSAYLERDEILDKLIACETRSAYYLAYDRLISEHAQKGNPETDSAIRRLSIFDGHVDEIREYAKDNQERTLMFLSLLCKINGLFLAREILDKDMTWYTHCRILNDFFVVKDPWTEITELDKRKNRLLLAPRGSYKSSCDIVDVTQLVICYPSVRVLLLTATIQLAKSFVGEIKNFFIAESAECLTPFQTIFAADARLEEAHNREVPRVSFLTSDTGKETEFICPARKTGDKKRREATIFAGSVSKTKAGSHCEWAVFDDPLDERSSETNVLIEKTIKKLGLATKLVDPGGHVTYIGTTYAPNDAFARIRADLAEEFVILVSPARELKKDAVGTTALERGKTPKDLDAVDYSLLFESDKHGREKLTWSFLEIEKKKDPANFGSQYLLDPKGLKQTIFSEAIVLRQMITREEMPQQSTPYMKYLLCDFAETTSDSSDYSSLSVLEVGQDGTGYITEINHGRYTPTELCRQVATMNHEHHFSRILIEDSKGASHLNGDIRRSAKDLGDAEIVIDWIRVDNSKAAKSTRISKLEPKLWNKMLYFLVSVEPREELIAELCDWPHSRHDDIIDSISFCSQVLGDERPKPMNPIAQGDAERILQQREMYEMFLGSPEDRIIDLPLNPLPGTELEGGTGDGHGNDLWDPFSVGQYGKR